MRGSKLVALALVWGCFGTGVLLACGGDDSSSGDAPDGSTTSSSGGSSGTNPDGSNGGPAIVADNVTIYTGTMAALDGSGTQAQTFAWVVKTIPPGSAVTTASLAGANTARPSFRTDVSGDYVLEVTATDGAGSTKKDVTVKAVPAPLFYMQSNFFENPAYFEYRVVGTDGTGGHPVACRTNGPTKVDGGDAGDDDESAGLALQAALLADMGEDWWESPNAAEPSRVAFVNFDYVDAGIDARPELNARLALGTNLSTCQNPPVKIAAVDPDGGGPAEGPGIVQPRFNRAGSRVAYVEKHNDRYYIVSVGYDGKDRRELAQYCEGPEDGCSLPALFPARPQWVNDSTVGWARTRNKDAGTGWEIVTANDSANPNAQVLMTCDGLAPRSIAFLKDGSIVANRGVSGPTDAGPREDLWILKPNATTKQCDVVRNLTNLPLDWSYARDFSISPDESEIAFTRFIQDGGVLPEGGGIRSGGDIYVGPLSGASAPVPASSAKIGALFGPRYVANAQMLAFNGGIPNDGGEGQLEDASGGRLTGIPVIAVIKRENGAVNYAAKSDPEAGTYVMGGGNGGGCDFRLDTCNVDCATAGASRGSGGGPTLLVTLAGFGWLFGRRRNRKRP